jgi:hypothetical protein
MKTKLAEIRQRWDKAKLKKSSVFWIVIGAIILTMYLGFSQAGWVTAGNALRMAEDASEDAVIARLAPICVTQFGQDLESDQRLAEFKELTSSSRRATYVKDQGWATMPGESTPDNKVASECAQLLMLIGE